MDEQDFKTHYFEYHQRLLSFTLRMTHDEQLANDLTQEAWMRAYRYWDRFVGDDRRPWLFTILRNVINSHYRRTQREREQTSSADLSVILQFIPDHETEALSAEEFEKIYAQLHDEDPERRDEAIKLLSPHLDEVLVEAIAMLNLDQRAAMLMQAMGMSYQEIAEIQEVKVGTIMSRLARARDKVKEYMQDKGFKLS